jgi:GAF domain-containing protein
MTGQPDQEQHPFIQSLMSSPRALEGVATLCRDCHHDMPGIDGAVLAMPVAQAGWIIFSDSGPHGDQLEDLYATIGEGPRVDAFTTGVPVAAADLVQARATWPRFSSRAPARGIRAVFAFPVQFGTVPVGVLSVYRSTTGELSATDHARAGRYARTATVLLRAAAYVNSAGQASGSLPQDATEVQQAIGVIMEHAAVDAATALHRLRAYAHHSRRSMRDVVAEVRADHLPFNPTTAT